MSLRLTNSLSRQKEDFKPVLPGHVGLYVCGPTVYGDPHLGHAKTYVSFDIDCLDPAFAPGTGTPVWGGLSSSQAAIILRDLAGINMVGGDVVEVSPPFDPTGATAVAGAHAAVELICLWASGKAKLKS